MNNKNMTFVCKNCKKQYINEKSYIKHEIICEKPLKDNSIVTLDSLLERIIKLEKELKSLKHKKMDIEEWLSEYYSENVNDFENLIIDINIRDLKHMFYNTIPKGIERILENHDLDSMKYVNNKMYYYVNQKWMIMPEKELQQFIQKMVKLINQTFDEYVTSENLLENEEGKYAIYMSKLYNSNLDKIIKKSIQNTCKVLYP